MRARFRWLIGAESQAAPADILHLAYALRRMALAGLGELEKHFQVQREAATLPPISVGHGVPVCGQLGVLQFSCRSRGICY
jgi:hypothetical protein